MKKNKIFNGNAVLELCLILCIRWYLLKKKIEDEFGVFRNTVSTIIDKLVELEILVIDSTYVKLCYFY